MNLAHIADLLRLPCSDKIDISGFSIDSRFIQSGQIFVALSGERTDGHDFIKDVADKGAAAVLCSRAVSGIDIPQLVVSDPIKSLGIIAAAHRKMMHCPVVALTGSNGKTSVKEMLSAIFPPPSLTTSGNLNNHIGVPLSVLRLDRTHRYAAFELGANHPGEIAYTVNIAQPDVALITNIAPAHIEGFGSIEGVAKSKGEIYRGLRPGGTAIINEDDDYAHFWDDSLSDKKVIRFSLQKAVDIYAKDISLNAQGFPQFSMHIADTSIDMVLNVPGEHNISNALAAASCSHALGLSIDEIVAGLHAFKGVPGRMSYLKGKNNATIIDDSYNANLRSVLTALNVLSSHPGQRIFVFGDMGELGKWTEAHHQDVGIAARKLGIDQVLTYGRHSQATFSAFEGTGRHYDNQDDLAQDLLPQLDEKTTVLVKGSRASKMEQLVQKLLIK